MGSEFAPYFDWMSVVAGLMALVWFLRLKSKGSRAIVMCLAFLTFAGLAQAIKLNFPLIGQIAVGVVLVFLLGLDMALRSAKSQEDRK